MKYLRPALSATRFSKVLASTPAKDQAAELARLVTGGGCSPDDLSAYLATLGKRGGEHRVREGTLRKGIADEMPYRLRMAWARLQSLGHRTDDAFEPEAHAMRVFCGTPKAGRKDAVLAALDHARCTAALPSGLGLLETLDLSREESAIARTKICAMLERGRDRLPPAAIAALSKGRLLEGTQFLPARMLGVLGAKFPAPPQGDERAFVERFHEDLKHTHGLHFIQQRLLGQLESFRSSRARYSDWGGEVATAVVRKYNPGTTANGREKEIRAFFAILAECADLHRSAEAGDSASRTRLGRLCREIGHAESLRAFREVEIKKLAEFRATRIASEYGRAAGVPPARLARGLRDAPKETFRTAQDIHTMGCALQSYVDQETDVSRTRKALGEAMAAFARGGFVNWKFSHRLADQQLEHLSPEQRARWVEDHSWTFVAPSGEQMRVREASDIRETLYYAERPVSSCCALLADGANGHAGIAPIVDANKKIAFIETEDGGTVGRCVVRTLRMDDGEPAVIVERCYERSGRARIGNIYQAAVVAGMAKKLGSTVEVCAGIVSTDEEQTEQANDVLGLAAAFDAGPHGATLPPSLAGHEYIDSCADVDCVLNLTERTKTTLALLRNADQAKGLPEVSRPEATPSPLGPEEGFLANNQRAPSMVAKVLARIFPNAPERERFMEEHPDAIPTGDVPHGAEGAWRSVLKAAPESANFLHHANFATAFLRGAPNPDKKGEDFRLAVAVAESQPAFASLIGGLARSEIARFKEAWVAEISEQVAEQPSDVRWAPQINLRRAISSVVLPQERKLAFAEAAPSHLFPLPEAVVRMGSPHL